MVEQSDDGCEMRDARCGERKKDQGFGVCGPRSLASASVYTIEFDQIQLFKDDSLYL